MWINFWLLTQFAGVAGRYRQKWHRAWSPLVTSGVGWVSASSCCLVPASIMLLFLFLLVGWVSEWVLPRACCPPWLSCCCCSYWSALFSFYPTTVCKTANSVAALQRCCNNFFSSPRFQFLSCGPWSPPLFAVSWPRHTATQKGINWHLQTSKIVNEIKSRKIYQLMLIVRLFKILTMNYFSCLLFLFVMGVVVSYLDIFCSAIVGCGLGQGWPVH